MPSRRSEVIVIVREGAELNVAARVSDYTPYFDETITLRPALVSAEEYSDLPRLEDQFDSDDQGDNRSSSNDTEGWESRKSLGGGVTTYASDIVETSDETTSNEAPWPLPLGPFSEHQRVENAK